MTTTNNYGHTVMKIRHVTLWVTWTEKGRVRITLIYIFKIVDYHCLNMLSSYLLFCTFFFLSLFVVSVLFFVVFFFGLFLKHLRWIGFDEADISMEIVLNNCISALNWLIQVTVMATFQHVLGPSWLWSHSSWIYDYLWNQCLSSLRWEIEPRSWRGVLDTLCDQSCQ